MRRLIGLMVLLLPVGLLFAETPDLLAVELVSLGKYQIVVKHSRDRLPEETSLLDPPVFESKRMRSWYAADGAQLLSLVLWLVNTSAAEINGAEVELRAIGNIVPLDETIQADKSSVKFLGILETRAIVSIAAGEMQVVRFADLTMADLYGDFWESGLWPETVIFEVVFNCKCSSEGTSTTVHLIPGD